MNKKASDNAIPEAIIKRAMLCESAKTGVITVAKNTMLKSEVNPESCFS